MNKGLLFSVNSTFVLKREVTGRRANTYEKRTLQHIFLLNGSHEPHQLTRER